VPELAWSGVRENGLGRIAVEAKISHFALHAPAIS
jgi:hypothetical protein